MNTMKYSIIFTLICSIFYAPVQAETTFLGFITITDPKTEQRIAALEAENKDCDKEIEIGLGIPAAKKEMYLKAYQIETQVCVNEEQKKLNATHALTLVGDMNASNYNQFKGYQQQLNKNLQEISDLQKQMSKDEFKVKAYICTLIACGVVLVTSGSYALYKKGKKDGKKSDKKDIVSTQDQMTVEVA